jgi:hypothetical protein
VLAQRKGMKRLTTLALSIYMVIAIGAPLAHADDIPLGEMMNTETKEVLQVKIPKASPAELLRDSPAGVNDEIRRQCNKGINVIGIARTFTTESMVFYSAQVLHALIDAEGDPAALRHFAEQSLKDPVAHVSFGAFMVGNHGAMKFFMQRDWLPDLCAPFRKGGKVKPWIAHPEKYPKPRYSRAFQFLAPGFGMSAGMMASNFTAETLNALRSPDMKACSARLIRKVDLAESNAACTRAYNSFFAGRKWRNYPTMITSMMMVASIQGAMRAAGDPRWMKWVAVSTRRSAATKVTQVAIRSVAMMTRVGSWLGGPYVKIAVSIANLISFFYLDEKVMSVLMPPWEAYWDIAKSA